MAKRDQKQVNSLAKEWQETAQHLAELTFERKASLSLRDTWFLIKQLVKMPLAWLAILVPFMAACVGYFVHHAHCPGSESNTVRVRPDRWDFEVDVAKADPQSWLNQRVLAPFISDQTHSCNDLRAHGKDCMVIGIRTSPFAQPTPQLKVQMSATADYHLAGVVLLDRRESTGESYQLLSEGFDRITVEVPQAAKGDRLVLVGRLSQSSDVALPAPETLHTVLKVEGLQ